jgi:hypothetical protein
MTLTLAGFSGTHPYMKEHVSKIIYANFGASITILHNLSKNWTLAAALIGLFYVLWLEHSFYLSAQAGKVLSWRGRADVGFLLSYFLTFLLSYFLS